MNLLLDKEALGEKGNRAPTLDRFDATVVTLAREGRSCVQSPKLKSQRGSLRRVKKQRKESFWLMVLRPSGSAPALVIFNQNPRLEALTDFASVS